DRDDGLRAAAPRAAGAARPRPLSRHRPRRLHRAERGRPQLYGSMQVRVSANEACRLALDPSGSVPCATSITDQGQATRNALAQIIAEEIGIDPADVDVVSGDTATTPFGGGAWASRATALGSEAALRAARRLKQSILAIAGSLLQAEPAALRLEGGKIVNV